MSGARGSEGAKRSEAIRNFARARKAVLAYERSLRSIARQVGQLINGHPTNTKSDADDLQKLLAKYADVITPYANSIAARMIADVNARDKTAWRKAANEMSAALRRELIDSNTGPVMADLMKRQVELIKSLPTEAGERVHRLVVENMTGAGVRASVIADQIAASGHVTETRATLIARTETSRATSVLTQARAQNVGSTGYIWRTSRDAAVRPSHRKMQGIIVSWDNPPTLDGLKGHAGALPNCRCWPDPIIPEN